MPDEIFDHPRLARIYDPLDPDRSDLDTYVNLVDEFGATSVLDVGCGTGTLGCLLANRGIRVLGVDPAGASVKVARTKVGADRVTWVVGIAPDIAADPSHQDRYDLATLTGNVAQVFLDDHEWRATLQAVRTCLRPGGRIAFESRVPSEHPIIFLADGERVDSISTLRFRPEEAFNQSLTEAGFTEIEIRDLPYAPGRGWLIIARAQRSG